MNFLPSCEVRATSQYSSVPRVSFFRHTKQRTSHNDIRVYIKFKQISHSSFVQLQTNYPWGLFLLHVVSGMAKVKSEPRRVTHVKHLSREDIMELKKSVFGKKDVRRSGVQRIYIVTNIFVNIEIRAFLK